MTERERRFYVFRVNYDQHKSFIEEELKAGRLRQGWGPVSLVVSGDGGYDPEPFAEGYANAWGKELKVEAIKRYGILFPMLEMQPGDLVVVPKIPDWESFTLAEVSGTYYFDLETPKQRANVDDFGHVIPVDPTTLKVFRYDENINTHAISRYFRGYQKAVNNVWIKEFKNATLALKQSSSPSASTSLDQQLQDEVLENLKKRLAQLKPGYVEHLVAKAFEQAGYELTTKHRYNRQGGDADLILTLKLPLLAELNDASVKVFVQVKNKQGIDYQDSEGIRQLVEIAGDPSNIKVLVSTADELTEEASKLALENNVQLVVGPQALKLIARGIVG